MTLKVAIDYKKHENAPAMVQTFINAYTGDEVEQKHLEGLNLDHIFTDAWGRKVLVFESIN